MRRKILGIVHESENNALLGASYEYGRIFDKHGYQTDVIDLRVPGGFDRMHAQAQATDVAFAFGIQGIGGRLTTADGQNLWHAARLPFVGIHFDHPCYNPFNHTTDTPYVGSVYPFASFQRVKERYLPSCQLVRHVPFSLLEEPPVLHRPFAQRSTRILYLKTGTSLDALQAEMRALPPQLAALIRIQIARAEKDPNLELADLVADIYESLNVDRHAFQLQFWDNVRWMDRYLRAVRAIRFVEWLKHQDGAVIIGRGWDFIDKTNIRARFLPAVDVSTLFEIYADTRFVCNTNPYGSDILHERIIAGLNLGCAVISDGNAWWDQHFADVPALLRFRWDAPLDDQIAPFLADEKRAEALASHGHDDVLSRIPPTQIPQILSFAQDLRVFAQRAVQA